MSYALEQEQRKCRALGGKLLRFTLAWKAFPSFCLQPQMILAYPVPSAWPENPPFPKRLWGKSKNEVASDLTLQTKDAMVLLQERLRSRQGPATNSSLLSTKGGAQLGCFFQAPPLPLPLMGYVILSKAWACFKVPEVCSMFSDEMMYFHLFRKHIIWVPTWETVCWAGQRFDAFIPGDCGS